MAPSEGLL